MPGRINFLLNDKVVGTTTTRVPGTVPAPDPTVNAAELMMRWTLQTETELNYNYIPAKNEAHIKVDWVAVWKYVGP